MGQPVCSISSSAISASPVFQLASSLENKVARHSTALRERRYRCYLPVLAEFTRLLMHGTWPGEKVGAAEGSATGF